MDILDIDEALKDDSFICLEDKTHDDVSNILQQWKSNNCLLPAQYQQEQAYKLNSRTFTRPRRKSTQNLEQHFAHSSGNHGVQTAFPIHQEQLQQKFTIATPQPAFNLEIGGLVTTMHKSFLQDTSPPSSICSSMEMSMERMNNSLITSADFTNINFLQSTQSLDFNEPTLNGSELFNLANKATSDGYTLSDMIRDRKALESLTLSGDGTLIKDSHIGQIDDISLAFSKTASGSSTMDNSTESMQEDHQQQQRNVITAAPNAHTVGVFGNSAAASKSNIMHRTILLSDEVIGDTTFELVESSLCENNINGINGNDSAAPTMTTNSANETFKRPWNMDETVCIPNRANATYEFKQLTPDARLASSETRCETPENMAETIAARKFYESTPHTAGLYAGAQPNTPTTSKLYGDEVNISPIVAATEQVNANATHVLSGTFGEERDVKKVNTKTFSGTLPRLESIEQMLDDIENPNETYEKSGAKTQVLQQSAADIQMQNVLELAHAEEELLASNNDQEFEDMLEEFSKVEVNAEHVKMKKSLETIKRRFQRDPTSSTKAPTLQQAHSTDDATHKPTEMQAIDECEQRRNGSYIKADVTASVISDCTAPSGVSSPSSASISASSAASSLATSGIGNSSGAGERLLSRRSRLYDNINLSTISAGSSNTQSPSRSLGASFTVHKRDDSAQENCAIADATAKQETDYKNEQEENNFGKTEGAIENSNNIATTNYNGVGTYKLSERRERDRDRFKTIKIVKARNVNEDLVAVNVPCIDDDDVSLTADGGTTVFNNNKSEIENEQKLKSCMDSQSTVTRPTTASKINPNFLTYKKPKDKPTNVANLPEIVSAPLPSAAANGSSEELENQPIPPSRLRSRSRPRYISGLQKMTVVKATSAGDLDRATALGIRPPTASVSHAALDTTQHINATIVAEPTKYSRNAQPLKTTTTAEVKSPMGTKSKSFHNLSSNFGFNGGTGLHGPRANSLGLKKPTVYEGAGAANDRIANGLSSNSIPPQLADDAVFKVPKLVSGLRAPGAKRAGLVRPSSAYYSLNSLAVKGMPSLSQPPLVNDTDSDGGRHSPTDSMSSASSRGSIQNGGIIVEKPYNANATTTKSTSITTNANTLNLTKFTTGSKGIPKPSGLRPPTTNIKRSGLPKPVTGLTRR
ncbi:serine-rich adhesin for platelets isoform X2 [Bactrocera oleae]|uniref:serine-rich adhesin for platelets isoform X2 n=1 Tax=Bactrocera oleae TaxID=104688 RepID=UPI00387E6813